MENTKISSPTLLISTCYANIGQRPTMLTSSYFLFTTWITHINIGYTAACISFSKRHPILFTRNILNAKSWSRCYASIIIYIAGSPIHNSHKYSRMWGAKYNTKSGTFVRRPFQFLSHSYGVSYSRCFASSTPPLYFFATNLEKT